MKLVVVGISDCAVSSDPEAQLVTYALGSCIAVTLFDPIARVAGLLHFMLPESTLDRDKAAKNPAMFADTGIPLLFRRAYDCGAGKRRLVVRVAGGAQMADERGVFNIGKRNYLAMRKILWKAGVLIDGEAVGGMVSRTLRLDVATGRLWLREGGVEREMSGQSGGGPIGAAQNGATQTGTTQTAAVPTGATEPAGANTQPAETNKGAAPCLRVC
ncbi:MAG: chemotaxis protein CheD [Bryobacteraceae bacterium]